MVKKNAFKNFSFVAAGRVISAGLGGFFYLAFASLLEPEKYGEMSYIIALAATFSIISRFGLPLTVTVYLGKNNLNIVNQVNVLVILTSGIASIILLFINVYASLLCFGLSLYLMTEGNLVGLRQYKKFLAISTLRGVLIIVIPLAFYFVFDLSGVILGMAIGYLLCIFPYIKSLKRKIDNFRDVREKINILIHNFGIEASQNLPRMVDKLLIVPLLGFAITCIYQFNFQILLLLQVLPTALYSFLLSEESRGIQNKKMIYLVVVGSGLLSFIVILVAPTLIPIFFSKYSDGILGLQIMSLSLVPFTISSVINAKLQARESTKIGYSAIIRIGSLLGFIAVLSEPYGLVGLSISIVSSVVITTVFLLFLYYQSRRVEKKGNST